MRRLPRLCILAVVAALAGAPGVGRAQTDVVVRNGTVVYPGLDVNIADAGRLVRLHLAFEVQCVDETAARMAASAQVREAILLFLRDKTAAEIMTPTGKARLKNDLVGLINKSLGGPRAVRIYFLQFIIL